MKTSKLSFQASKEETKIYREASIKCGMKYAEWARHALDLALTYGEGCPVAVLPKVQDDWINWDVGEMLTSQVKRFKPYGKWVRQRLLPIAQWEIEHGPINGPKPEEEGKKDGEWAFPFRIDKERKIKYKQAAGQCGWTLTRWIRTACDKYLEGGRKVEKKEKLPVIPYMRRPCDSCDTEYLPNAVKLRMCRGIRCEKTSEEDTDKDAITIWKDAKEGFYQINKLVEETQPTPEKLKTYVDKLGLEWLVEES